MRAGAFGLVLLLPLLPAPAVAGAVGFSGGIGTLGTEMTLSTKLSPYFDALISYQQMDVDTKLTDDDRNTLDITVETSAPRLGIQYYPFPTLGLAVEAGMVFGAPDIFVDAKPDASSQFTVGPRTYFTSQIGTLTGTVAFEDENAPYLLFNIGRTTSSGFNLNLSLGAVAYGAPKVTLKNSQCALESNAALNAIACATLQDHIKEEELEVNKDLEEYQYWPLIRLGLSYSF